MNIECDDCIHGWKMKDLLYDRAYGIPIKLRDMIKICDADYLSLYEKPAHLYLEGIRKKCDFVERNWMVNDGIRRFGK